MSWTDGTVEKADGKIDAFTISLADGACHEGRRLILATGVSDALPDIPGLGERWGKFVFHCPYCHGYELDEKPLGVLALGPLAVPQALMVSEWGPTTLFVNGSFAPDKQQCALLSAAQIGVEEQRIERLTDDGRLVTVYLDGGKATPLAGIFVMPKTSLQGSLAEQLGCELDEGITGSYVRVDPMKTTSVAGVFAAGDAASMAGSVTFAVSDGARAGISAHHSLIAGLSAAHARMQKRS